MTTNIILNKELLSVPHGDVGKAKYGTLESYILILGNLKASTKDVVVALSIRVCPLLGIREAENMDRIVPGQP